MFLGVIIESGLKWNIQFNRVSKNSPEVLGFSPRLKHSSLRHSVFHLTYKPLQSYYCSYAVACVAPLWLPPPWAAAPSAYEKTSSAPRGYAQWLQFIGHMDTECSYKYHYKLHEVTLFFLFSDTLTKLHERLSTRHL